MSSAYQIKDNSSLDRQIETLKECKALTENEIKNLCEKVASLYLYIFRQKKFSVKKGPLSRCVYL